MARVGLPSRQFHIILRRIRGIPQLPFIAGRA